MSVKNRLYIGFGAVLLLIIILSLIALSMINKMNKATHEIAVERYAKVRSAKTVQQEINNINRELRDLLYIHNYDDHTDMNNIEKYRLKALRELDSLTEAGHNEWQVIETASEIKTLLDSYIALEKQVLLLFNNGQGEETFRLLQQDGRSIRAQIFQKIDRLIEMEEQYMNAALSRSQVIYEQVMSIFALMVLAGLFIGLAITLWIIRSTADNIKKLTGALAGVNAGSPMDKLPRVIVDTRDEIGEIAEAYNVMAEVLEQKAIQEKEHVKSMRERHWLKSEIANIATRYQGLRDYKGLAQLIMSHITPVVGASYGVFYLREDEGARDFIKLATYAGNKRHIGFDGFQEGEGLAGQCARENKEIYLTEVPENYIKIKSGLGLASPKSIIILPISFEGRVMAVVEMASFDYFSPLQQSLLRAVLDNASITMKEIAYLTEVEKLLKETQALSEELHSQSEELQLQQEELESINEQLEEQYKDLEIKTGELERTKGALEEKACQLAQTSRYKSEFLANMSHELRTPLNSMLILAQMLAEDTEGNLTARQMEYAGTILSSGRELLTLINDILDLSKIEFGKMTVIPADVQLTEIKDFVERQFSPLARQRGVEMEVLIEDDLPETMYTDEQRLKQILKNLLANAFKFTDRGSVTLHISRAGQEVLDTYDFPAQGRVVLAFSVRDTGIGIPREKQDIIFEAFQQANGTTSRKYGGTGLGLAICREIARLLGGVISLDSVAGVGSTFTLYIPEYYTSQTAPGPAGPCHNNMKNDLALTDDIINGGETAASLSPTAGDAGLSGGFARQDDLLTGKRVLILDGDMRSVFALTSFLEGHRMEVIFADNLREGIGELEKNPDIDLIIMDIMTPGDDGYEALRAIRRLPGYQRVPIIALADRATEMEKGKCIKAGASDYMKKPVQFEQLWALMKVWMYKA